jgi:hypothetical protein
MAMLHVDGQAVPTLVTDDLCRQHGRQPKPEIGCRLATSPQFTQAIGAHRSFSFLLCRFSTV